MNKKGPFNPDNPIFDHWPDDIPIPYHKQKDDGDWETRDIKDDKKIGENKTPKGPNGQKPKPFEKFDAVLLHDIEDPNGFVTHEKGEDIKVQMFPGGRWSVVRMSTIIITEAEEGVNFKFKQ